MLWLKAEIKKRAKNTKEKCAKLAENTETIFATATGVVKHDANIATKCVTLAGNIEKTAGIIAATIEPTTVRRMVAPMVITTSAHIAVPVADFIAVVCRKTDIMFHAIVVGDKQITQFILKSRVYIKTRLFSF